MIGIFTPTFVICTLHICRKGAARGVVFGYGSSWLSSVCGLKTQPYDVELTMICDQNCRLRTQVLLISVIQWVQSANLTTPDPFKHDVKMEDSKDTITKTDAKVDTSSPSLLNAPLSTAAESVITFVSVFIVGCVITLSVYTWRRFKPSPWRYVIVIF